MKSLEWMKAAACRDHPPALFFPVPQVGVSPDYGPALAVCNGCTVVGSCRAWAEHCGDIADGHTVHGQVVGGCRPPANQRVRTQRLPRMCALPSCRQRFMPSGSGANIYCCPEHSEAGRKLGRQRR